MEFVKAHRAGDKDRMKEIAAILSHFKGYSQCVDAFIEEAQHVGPMGVAVVCYYSCLFMIAASLVINIVGGGYLGILALLWL